MNDPWRCQRPGCELDAKWQTVMIMSLSISEQQGPRLCSDCLTLLNAWGWAASFRPRPLQERE